MARLLTAFMVLAFCSAVLAGDVAKVSAKDDGGTAVKAKSGVTVEGLQVAPSQASRSRRKARIGGSMRT